jgi:Talin, middle domain
MQKRVNYLAHLSLILIRCVTYSSSNIGEFSKDVRMLAALEEAENDGDKLLEAARRLAGAFSELLTVAQPGSNEVNEVSVVFFVCLVCTN